jgi:hypothetical protein
MFSKHIIVTPELAADILAHRNKTGRPLSRERVRRYLDDMNSNRWADNPQGISFDGENELSNLVDGQHRMTAIKLSGKPQPVYAHFEVPPESVRVMDQGLTRTAAQLTAADLAEGTYEPENAASRLSSAARIIVEYGLGQAKPSNTLITEYTRQNVRVLDHYGFLGKLYKAGTHAAFAFAELSGMRGVKEAAHRLGEMTWSDDADPMRALARSLAGVTGQGAKAQRTMFYTTLAALEYIDRGEGLLVARKYQDMPTRVSSSVQLRSSLPQPMPEVA